MPKAKRKTSPDTLTPEDRRAFRRSVTWTDQFGMILDVTQTAIPPLVGALVFGMTLSRFLALVWFEALALLLANLVRDVVMKGSAVADVEGPRDLRPEERRYIVLAERWKFIKKRQGDDAAMTLRDMSEMAKSRAKSVQHACAAGLFGQFFLGIPIGLAMDSSTIFPGAVRATVDALQDPAFWPYLGFLVLGTVRDLTATFLERRSPMAGCTESRRALGVSWAGKRTEYGAFLVMHFWILIIAAAIASKGGEVPPHPVVFVAVVCVYKAIFAGIASWMELKDRYLWRLACEQAASGLPCNLTNAS